MEFTRKQKILLWALIGGALLVLTGFLVWIALSVSETPPAEPQMPSASPLVPSEVPTAQPTPTPAPTPAPTPYRLPLVPEGDAATERPEAPPQDAQAERAAARIRTDAQRGAYSAEQKEFLAIGTLSGEAIAVLLVQAKPPAATVVAIPCETLAPVYTLGENCAMQGVELAAIGTSTARAESLKEGCWNLVWAIKNLTGYLAPEYLCVDFACMESFFAYAPSIEAETGAITLSAFRDAIRLSGAPRAAFLASFGVAVSRHLMHVSLWELPGFRNATRDAFSSSLSVPELFFLLRTMRGVTSYSYSVLPTETQDGALVYTGETFSF